MCIKPPQHGKYYVEDDRGEATLRDGHGGRSVMSSTIEAATPVAAGQAAATRAISAKVAALTEEVLKTMLLTKLKIATAMLVMLGTMTVTGAMLTGRQGDDRQEVPGKDKESGSRQATRKTTPMERDSDPLVALWSANWGREHKDVTPSTLKIDLSLSAKVTRTKTALVLPVKITNHSSQEIVTRLAHEWHGGKWPRTNLYASATSSKAKKAALFAPVYLVGEDQHAARKTTIAPGKSVNVELRMDWPGTGSRGAQPLMAASVSGTYKVRLLMVFEVEKGRQFVATDEKTVELPAK